MTFYTYWGAFIATLETPSKWKYALSWNIFLPFCMIDLEHVSKLPSPSSSPIPQNPMSNQIPKKKALNESFPWLMVKCNA